MKKISIYKDFSKRLVYAITAVAFLLSIIFYGIIKSTIFEEIQNDLIKYAQVVQKASLDSLEDEEATKLLLHDEILVDLVTIDDISQIHFKTFKIDENNFAQILHPFNQSKNTFIKIQKNINSEVAMLNKIFSNLILFSFGAFILIILYAFAISKTLLTPIFKITDRLSKMDGQTLDKINVKALPMEFLSLANSINQLTNKISNYVKYQKELFIGTAHELKTPLAVMKLKSEVTLLKERSSDKYKETLRIFIQEINRMDTMTSSILDMGRQESAQFENPKEIDIVTCVKSKIDNYKLLSSQKNIKIIFNTDIEHFKTIIQPTLLNQILQNFVQNSIKFTQENKIIYIHIRQMINNASNKCVRIDVIDEGIGLDDNIDYFAPFTRKGRQTGAGLGLFLAKSAADSLGADISLTNKIGRTTGTIASLILTNNPQCRI